MRTWDKEGLGAIKTPECDRCNTVKKVDTEKLLPHATKDEWEYHVTCHGDRQVYHMSREFLDLMKEAKKTKEFLNPFDKDKIKMGVPDAFNHANTTRIDGVRHMDCMIIACKMAGLEAPLESETEAKNKFNRDFEQQIQKGNVTKIISKGKK